MKDVVAKAMTARQYDMFCDKVEDLKKDDTRSEDTKNRKFLLWFAETFYKIDLDREDITIWDIQELFDKTLEMTQKRDEKEIKNLKPSGDGEKTA